MENEDLWEDEEAPLGDASRRLAVMNCDWEAVKAIDLLNIFQSLCPEGGKIFSVKIYPSDFGIERMK